MGCILFHLTHDGTHRFAVLHRKIPGSERMLTQQLRELEDDGIVHREVNAEVPPKVEYSLTEYGKTLRHGHVRVGPETHQEDQDQEEIRRVSPTPWIDWYNSLAKPAWTPAPATIPLIWQMLYPIIVVSFGFVFVQAISKKLPWRVALPFAINVVTNLIFTTIQFGMRNLPLASVDILVVWATIIWMMVAVWRHYRWVALAQAPYFVWVSRAIVLQLSITAMDW